MSELQASPLVHFDDAGQPLDTKVKESELTDILKAADHAAEHINRPTQPKVGTLE